MKILNFGSLNIDHVYQVDHFVRPGETLSSLEYNLFCGGKGLNQSIALSYAGADVYHAGKVGHDGQILIDKLKECGIITKYIKVDTGVSGHALIQVDKNGQNCIILHGGSNQKIAENEIKEVLDNFSNEDYLLLQNEINNIDIIMKTAKEKNVKIVLNPAPMDEKILKLPLELVDIFIVNEVEGSDLTGEKEPNKILDSMLKNFPNAATVLTLGSEGVMYIDKYNFHSMPADTSVKVVDTTAAGDTFIGYFLSGLSKGTEVEKAIKTACKACDICVSRPGASGSIPKMSELGI